MLYAFEGRGLLVLRSNFEYPIENNISSDRFCMNHDPILRTSRKGRGKLTAIKVSIIAYMSILLTLTIYAPQVLLIGEKGYHDLNATAQSLAFLRFVPFPITILGYLILIFVIRIIATFIVGVVVMLISKYSRNAITAVCISASIIILPAVLSQTGVLPIRTIADLIGFCVVH